MRTVRILVVDDEPPARSRIRQLLDRRGNTQVVGEARNGAEALKLIQRLKPDLVFLDIQMPDLNGFDLLKQLDCLPMVVFVTAYDQYALKAFDVHAVDYLLKPFDDDRFEEALQLALDRLTQRESQQFNQKLLHLIQEYQHQTSATDEFIEITDKGRTVYIRPDEVYFVEAQGNYLEMHLFQKKYLYRNTMQGLESQFGTASFLRIHRSFFINTTYIQSYRYIGNNEYRFVLTNGTELVSGRSYKEAIQQRLGQG